MVGQTIHALSKAKKAIPHGDCFEVAAGGHFTTAGWDVILTRKYGLGCQSVLGGRVVLWDGTVLDVDERSHPELLWALRGGAAAGVGVVSELRLQVFDEPAHNSWRLTSLGKVQLETCVLNQALARANHLPREISVAFRLFFEPDNTAPVCSFIIFSLLGVSETLECLRQTLGDAVTDLVADAGDWRQGPLMDIRMIPASDFMAQNPDMLAELTAPTLKENPFRFWEDTSTRREMGGSYFTSRSSWTIRNCDSMLFDLYQAFETVQDHRLRSRMYAVVFVGGGKVTEMQDRCAMPLGDVLTRFELHWDEAEPEVDWCREFTDRIYAIMKTAQDPGVGRLYRGDIWLKEQGADSRLDAILARYETRYAQTPPAAGAADRELIPSQTAA